MRVLADDLLDPGGMDAAVLQELVERAPGDFAPHRVEGGDRDRLGRVVDDQVDAGRLLQGADVAPLAADDAALHIVRWERNDRDSRLGNVVGGDALDGGGQDPAGPPVSFFAQLQIELVQAPRGQTARLFLDLTHQLVSCLIRRQPGNTLQLLEVAVTGGIELCLLPGPVGFELRLFAAVLGLPGFACALRLLVEPAQLLLAAVERDGFLIDRFLFLLDPALDALDFLAPLGQFPVELRTQADGFVFGLESGVASSSFNFLQDTVGLRLHLAGMRIGAAFQVPPGREKGGNDDEHGLEDAEDDVLGIHRHP